MKHLEKYLYLVIIIILIGVITCGIIYIISAKNENNDITNNKDNDNNFTEETSPIVLRTEELEKYLKYIPNDKNNNNQNMYKKPNTVTKLSAKTILGATLNFASLDSSTRIENEYKNGYYFKKNIVSDLMNKLYNKQLGEYTADAEKIIAEFNCYQYYYNDNLFMQSSSCTRNNTHINYINKYYATEDELIIYEYAALAIILEDKVLLTNYINEDNKSFTIPKYNALKLDVGNYIEDNNNIFVLYKHTFKVNNNGYYWYKTENV